MNEVKQTAETKASTSRNQQIVVFKLGQEEYGLSIDQIKEVVITPNITQMPQTPAFVKGVANIRGNVIAILDLEEKFKLQRNKDVASTGNNYTLVIESDEYKMGIMVHEVPNTLSISTDSIESSIFTGDQQSDQSYIIGIVKLEKRLIIMIDIFKVISEQEANQFSKKQAEAEV
ncbi:MAG TPA: chemotaxis protein CheW [Cyclobacteriaceae bacterium]